MSDKILTPISLWKDFDDSLPLKDIVINTYKSDTVNFSNIYFSGRKVDKNRVRIYGVYAEPSSAPKGTILIIPDVSDSVDREMVFHFAKQNYAVLSIDIKGNNDVDNNFTKYPQEISYANYKLCGRTFDYCDKSAKETCWYEWTAVARYGVSFLKNKFPNLNVGVLGIKNGANVGWMLAGTDNRISGCTFLYGAGWLAYKGIYKNSDLELQTNDERYRFLAGIESQTYAPFIECPIMYISSTNSKNFDVERAVDTILRVKDQNKCWFNFITTVKDCLDEHCLNTIDYFFNKFIGNADIYMPKTPEISMKIDGDDLVFEVDYDDSLEVDGIYVLSSSNDINPETRVWYNVPPTAINKKGKTQFIRRIFGQSFFEISYVAIKYKCGVTISSKFKFEKTDIKGVSKIPGIMFSSSKLHSNFIVEDIKTSLMGNVFPVDKLYTIKKGPVNIWGIFSENTLTSYAIKKLSGYLSDESFIKFDVYTKFYEELSVKICTEDGLCFKYVVKLKGGDFWKSIMIEISDFKDENGVSIKDYSKILSISLSSVGSFMVNNFIVF